MAELDFSDIVGKSSTKDSLDFSDITAKATPAAPEKRSISDIMRGKGLKNQDLASGLKVAGQEVLGIGSGLGQLVTGLGELAPGELGQQAARVTKELQKYGYPETQAIGKYALPAIAGYEYPILAGLIGGAVMPTGEEDQSKRYAEKTKESLIGGALGVIPRAAGVVRSAIAPEAVLASKVAERSTPSAVGKTIIDNVVSRLKGLREGRSEEARALFENFYRDAQPVEEFVRQGYLQDLRTTLLAGEKTLSPEEKSVFKEAIRKVSEDSQGAVPGIEALDKERRILKESIDPSATGADAIKNEAYKKAHDLLLKNITSRVKTASDTYQRYAELSKDINDFSTGLGRKITTPAGEYLPEVPRFDPKKVSGEVFNSELSVNTFKKLANNDKLVNDLALQHIANDLPAEASAAEIKAYRLNPKNSDWLQAVPEVNKKLENAESALRSGARLRKGTLYTLLGLGAADALKGVKDVASFVRGE